MSELRTVFTSQEIPIRYADSCAISSVMSYNGFKFRTDSSFRRCKEIVMSNAKLVSDNQSTRLFRFTV